MKTRLVLTTSWSMIPFPAPSLSTALKHPAPHNCSPCQTNVSLTFAHSLSCDRPWQSWSLMQKGKYSLHLTYLRVKMKQAHTGKNPGPYQCDIVESQDHNPILVCDTGPAGGTLWVTSAELTCLKPPAPPSDRGICDFGRGAGGLGPFLPSHCPCAKCSARRTSHGNNQIPPSLQNIPKFTSGRAVGDVEKSMLGRCRRVEEEIGCKSLPLSINPPTKSGSFLCSAGHSLIWVPVLYLTISQ